MAAECRDVFAGEHRMCVRLGRLVAQPRHDGNAVVAKDHEAVVHVAHHARELELEDVVEAVDHIVGEIRIKVGIGHVVLASVRVVGRAC
jgi:hypothetical protein